MTGTIKAVIFDCDGTLVDSEVPGMDVLYEMACAEGLKVTRERAHHQFRGARMAECVAWISKQIPAKPPGFEAEFIKRARAAMTVRFQQNLDPLPGAFELLKRLRIPFCVATNGPLEKAKLTLTLTGLYPLLDDRIYSAYETGLFKPDPGLFLHAAAQLGVAPENCAVVEDSLPGIRAGLEAGMCVFSLHGREGLPEDVAQRVIFIDSLGEFDRRLHEHLGADQG